MINYNVTVRTDILQQHTGYTLIKHHLWHVNDYLSSFIYVMELYQINVIHVNRNFSCAINTDLILVVSCTTADDEINAGPKRAIVKQEEGDI